jgi:hypothetical protein
MYHFRKTGNNNDSSVPFIFRNRSVVVIKNQRQKKNVLGFITVPPTHPPVGLLIICFTNYFNVFYFLLLGPFFQMVTRTKKIFVGGLSAPTTLEDVKSYFEQFGPVSGDNDADDEFFFLIFVFHSFICVCRFASNLM